MKNIIVLILLLFNLSVYGQTLHVLVFADNISNLKESSSADKANLVAEIKRIVKYTNLKPKFYDKDHFSKEGCNSALSRINCSSEDVILFYYTGHGFRYEDQKLKYPFLAFGNSGSYFLKDKTPNLEEINDLLIGKKGRLVITIGDLCNSITKGIKEPIRSISGIDENAAKNYRNLFLNAKGNILIASSSPTQISIATEMGSIFTLAFIYNLRSGANNKKIATWEEIATKTEWLTNDFAQVLKMNQNPIYKIDIQY